MPRVCLWDQGFLLHGKVQKGSWEQAGAESHSLHKASEKGHTAGRIWPGRRGGEKLGYWRLTGFAEGYKKPRENKVTAEINRTQLLLKNPTGLCSYSAPVKTTRTLQTPLWSFNGYDA